MRSIFRKALLWSALALVAGIALGIEIVPALPTRTVKALAGSCECISMLKPGSILAAMRTHELHCPLRDPGNWLSHPFAVASALGPLVIF